MFIVTLVSKESKGNLWERWSLSRSPVPASLLCVLRKVWLNFALKLEEPLEDEHAAFRSECLGLRGRRQMRGAERSPGVGEC